MSREFVQLAAASTLDVAPSNFPSVWRCLKFVAYDLPKFVAYDVPKFLLYDAAWAGLAEGLGLREPQELPELRVPWGSDSPPASEGLPVRCWYS